MHEVEIIDGALVLRDRDGNGLESASLGERPDAERTVAQWAQSHAFDAADANRKIEAHFAASEAIAQIARRVLGIATMKVRGSDALDFHEVGVGALEQALRAADEAGRAAAR
jgi:Family of unknown function (DUF6900)